MSCEPKKQSSDAAGNNEELRHLIADVLEKHDGICLDDDGDRLRLLDALCEALSKPAN